MKVRCIRVDLKSAEEIRKNLLLSGHLRTDVKILSDETYVYFPLKKDSHYSSNFDILVKNLELHKKKVRSYKEIISVPKKLLGFLPNSYDIIGEIVIIKLHPQLLEYKSEIGRSILEVSKGCKTVCLANSIEGEYRSRPVEVIAGKKNTKTIHKEYGLKFLVDVSKVYFSPRLATERSRIARLVKKKETVIDLFAGVAPFSIMIAKFADPKIVYAIEKNKFAANLATENIRLNNVLDKVEVICTDAKNIKQITDDKGISANRYIMNLPFLAHKFFPIVLESIKKSSIIHYYDIIDEEKIEDRIDYLKKIATNKNCKLSNIEIRKMKTYSPREFYIGLDITVERCRCSLARLSG